MCRAVHWRGHSDRRSGHRNLGKDALFQIQELIQPLRGKDSPQEHARVQTPDPVDAPMALDKPHRVPWNIQIDDVAALLKIDALGEHVRSAPATNRMAFASRCEIQGRASRRHRLSACSKLSTARNRAVWDLGCRSAGRLLKRITDDYGRALICHVALSSASLPLLIRRPHREWTSTSTSSSLSQIFGCGGRFQPGSGWHPP